MSDYYPSAPRHFPNTKAEIQWLMEEIPRIEGAIRRFICSGGMSSIVVNHQHALERRKNRLAEINSLEGK